MKFVALPFILLLVGISYLLLQQPTSTTLPLDDHNSSKTEFHIHADLLVMLNGDLVDLSLDQYQSDESEVKSGVVHLHDNHGKIVHVHDEGVTLGEFLDSIGMHLSLECITHETLSYCRDESHTLEVWVNGEVIEDAAHYVIQDLDKILVSYGTVDTDRRAEYLWVTNDACIYSELCPERGEAPTENCIGGLGSECEL